MIKNRCTWPGSNELMVKYHDEEWGVPIHDDQKLFELLILEGAQAGLSWQTVLNKRENYRKAFDNFNPSKISNYKEGKIKELLNNSGIIRNKLKINAAILNAQLFLKTQKEFGTFDKYLWNFVNFKTIKNKFKNISEIQATTKESDELSLDLKIRGFKFVGSTICYAFMQSVGMVNDHMVNCFRYNQINNN